MTDHDAHQNAIVAEPNDDTVRLVYADWLDDHAGLVECEDCHGGGRVYSIKNYASGNFEETVEPCPDCHGAGRVSNGHTERAEFIRLQVEIARQLGTAGACDFIKTPYPPADSCLDRRMDLDDVLRSGCRTCRSRVPLWAKERELWPRVREIFRTAFGERFPGQWSILKESPPDDMGDTLYAIVRRGFVATVRGPLVVVRTTLPAVVREHPVETTEITNLTIYGPAQHRSTGGWFLAKRDIPDELVDHLIAAGGTHAGVFITWDTRRQVAHGISNALLAEARGRVVVAV